MRRRIFVGAILLVIAGGAVWWYTRAKLPPLAVPPTLQSQDGADPVVVKAIEDARQNVLAAPRSGAAWGDLGMTFAAHGYEPEADQCFTEAERLDPDDPRWPYYRALFAAVAKPEETIGHLRRALATKNAGAAPAGARRAVRLRLAEALLDRRELDEAETIFREELAQAPTDPRARFGLAHVALTRGDRRTARDEFGALVNNPYVRKRAASQCGALARVAEDLEAARHYEEIARVGADDPSWPDPYLQALRKHEVGQQWLLREVDALQAAGEHMTATTILLELVESDPKPRILVTAAIHLAKGRDFGRAESLLRECLRQDPGNSQANYFLGVVLFEQAGQLPPPRRTEAQTLYHAAAKYCRSAVTTKPDHGLAWLYLGRCLLSVGEAAGAVEALRQAVACRPEYTDTHLYLGEALAASGDKVEATREAQNAEKLAQPGDPRPRQLLDRLQPPVTPKK